MPSKKKKYNARFPAGRIKKIMQTDEEVGKVAQAVPVIISRTLELFVESLLTKSAQITQSRNAKTLTPSHMKQCILSESRFDFLKDLVKNIPDASVQEDAEQAALFTSVNPSEEAPQQQAPPLVQPGEFTPFFYNEQGTSAAPSVIQYGPPSAKPADTPKIDFTINSLVQKDNEPEIRIDLTDIIREPCTDIPPLVPLTRNNHYQGNADNLCIDEDYDN